MFETPPGLMLQHIRLELCLIREGIGCVSLLCGDQSLVHVRVGAVASAIPAVAAVRLRHTVTGNAPIPFFGTVSYKIHLSI